jgi:2-C-methyl-D-erythritol 4-phosphate cytidylyltransferase
VSVTAVIAAAGSGQRLGAGGPKAFVPVAGRPLVEWSLGAFRAAPSVGPIVIASPPGHAHDLTGEDVRVVDGGATRAESVSNALALVETELVAIHDAARPFVTPDLIEGVVATLSEDPEAAGAIAATPATDTIKEVASAPPTGRNAFSSRQSEKTLRPILRTLDRDLLWAAQTPQVFRVATLREALAADPEQIAAATDEATIVEASGGRVLIHPSPPENHKVTTPFDLRLAELLLGDRAVGG